MRAVISSPPSGLGLPAHRRLLPRRLELVGLVMAAVISAAVTAGVVALPAAAARVNPKVVIVAGPVGTHNSHYKSDADALASEARKYTSNVVLIKTPKATWPTVRSAAQGASVLVYLGHGNGWPSRYRDSLWPFTQNGFGLDPTTGADGTKHVYFGEAYIASEIRLAPNAVVLLFHLCYASGNTEPGLSTGTMADKKARVDNYGAGFFAAGARAVIADSYHPNLTYMTRLFTTSQTMSHLFHGVPTYHGHDIAWDSTRSRGARNIMDPTDVSSGPYYHSMVYDPHLTTTMVTRTAYPSTNIIPTRITVGGAGTTVAATTLFADAALGSAATTLEAGTQVHILADAPALPDGSRVVQVQPYERDLSGYVRAADLVPADGTPAKLYNYDQPGALVGPNGDYVHDTFRVIVRASEPLDGVVTVRNASGAVVKTLTASAAWSVFDWNLKLPDGALTPDGGYTWSYVGNEPAGNNPTPFTRSGTFILDATDPITSATVMGTLHPSGWYTSAATVSLSRHDALSGVASTKYTIDGGSTRAYGGAFGIGTSGNHAVTFWSVDRAGNVEAKRTTRVRIDLRPPVTTAALSGPDGDPGFFRDTVTVDLDASDAESGVASTEVGVDGAPLAPYTGPFAVTTAGPHHLAFRSTDRTGHTEPLGSRDFTIDRTAPSLGPADSFGPTLDRFSPNGDRLTDLLPIRHALTEPGAVRLVVRDGASNALVRTMTVRVATAGQGTISWDGRNDAGVVVPDGHYSLNLTPIDRAHNEGASRAATVDVFSAFVGLSPAPARFYPQDGDAIARRSVATFSLRAPADIELRIVNAAGSTVRTVTGSYLAGPVAIAWDGRSNGGTFVPQGLYRLVVSATVGAQSEVHTASVRAAAFELRPSSWSPRRGTRLTLTVISSEALEGNPRLRVRQPGKTAYTLTLTRIAPRTYRVRWTLRTGGSPGTMGLTVFGYDRNGGRNATSLGLSLR